MFTRSDAMSALRSFKLIMQSARPAVPRTATTSIGRNGSAACDSGDCDARETMVKDVVLVVPPRLGEMKSLGAKLKPGREGRGSASYTAAAHANAIAVTSASSCELC
jgi:hypothetical protein